MDWMKLGVLPDRFAYADTVIYSDVSTWACLSGIVRRRFRFHGRLRPVLGVYDRINCRVRPLALVLRRRRRPRILELLAGYDGTVIIVRRRRGAERLLGDLVCGGHRHQHQVGSPGSMSLRRLGSDDGEAAARFGLMASFGLAASCRRAGWMRRLFVAGLTIGAMN
jgi:hypothetical protein